MALTIITIILILIILIVILIIILILIIIIIVSHGVRTSTELLHEERVVCGQQIGHRNEIQLVQPGRCTAGGGVDSVDGAGRGRRGGVLGIAHPHVGCSADRHVDAA